MGGQGALRWERGVRQAAPDQGEGSQGSCPGRGDFQTETCAGTGRRPGNAPSDLYTRTVVQRMQKEPFAQRRWGLKPSRGKGRDGTEDGEVSPHGRGRQRGSTGHRQTPGLGRPTAVCPCTPPPGLFPGPSLQLQRAGLVARGPGRCRTFEMCAHCKDPGQSSAPWPAAALPAPTWRYVPGPPKHCQSGPRNEGQGPASQQVSSTPPERPLSQRLDLNFPLQGMFPAALLKVSGPLRRLAALVSPALPAASPRPRPEPPLCTHRSQDARAGSRVGSVRPA